MSLSLRERILQADDLNREAVDVPEWGLTVYVHTMTGNERDQLETLMAPGSGQKTGLRARVAVMTVRDESGGKVFTDADLGELAKKSSVALDRILEAALRVNAMTPAAVAELEKN